MFDVTTEGSEVVYLLPFTETAQSFNFKTSHLAVKKGTLMYEREREGSSVSIVSRLWAIRSGVRFLAGVRACSLLQRHVQSGSGARPASSLLSAGGYFPGGRVAMP